MTEKFKKEYLFDSETTYPTGTLLTIVEWLDKQIGNSSRWNLSQIKEDRNSFIIWWTTIP